MKTYDLTDKLDMIQLARDIQSKVYWNMTYQYYNSNGKVVHSRYKEFWEHLEYELLNGYVSYVSIDKDDTVAFIQ